MTGKEATHFHDVTSAKVEQFSNWGLTAQEGREIVLGYRDSLLEENWDWWGRSSQLGRAGTLVEMELMLHSSCSKQCNDRTLEWPKFFYTTNARVFFRPCQPLQQFSLLVCRIIAWIVLGLNWGTETWNTSWQMWGEGRKNRFYCCFNIVRNGSYFLYNIVWLQHNFAFTSQYFIVTKAKFREGGLPGAWAFD